MRRSSRRAGAAVGDPVIGRERQGEQGAHGERAVAHPRTHAIAPAPMIATCGGLMTGNRTSTDSEPRLVTVMVAEVSSLARM